jgi:hypothetical protein
MFRKLKIWLLGGITVEIYLKGGQVFRLKCKNFITKRSAVDNSLTAIEYTIVGPQLLYTRLDDISMIREL